MIVIDDNSHQLHKFKNRSVARNSTKVNNRDLIRGYIDVHMYEQMLSHTLCSNSKTYLTHG